ncbi:hypothetical protein NG800_003010 [Epilithonimonas ginsengisoli]|uniref:Uncharacterized protein n=1 Tax=Epilithonimonas ginsengisoli TaxID=1245592 RepID=A0ABU4JDX9_9FLAO|nr:MULTISPECIES: hypothetical protein [Chryseobacterium group]MBV6879018.1 hypothetical protein [Epilithonimonas sp. FP105]MDW8547866.1 hypothetical protein [Epilithonimonas ginsengisoli]OAH74927.1 hypothetical protein AXA65_05535 [Chryseobacterium sp. FP211-J200]
MALELQLAHCDTCNGYYSSTVLNPKDLHHPRIIDHFFYHGEPWFTLDRKTFDQTVDHQADSVRIIDFEDHIKDDQRYCTCGKKTKHVKEHLYYLAPSTNRNKKTLTEYVDQDIYFYDLYITYNNFHQDLPTRQAI